MIAYAIAMYYLVGITWNGRQFLAIVDLFLSYKLVKNHACIFLHAHPRDTLCEDDARQG